MTVRKLNAETLTKLLGAWSLRGPAYRDLAQALRQTVLDGRVPLEVRLPGERDLAAALGVSRTTVTSAYTALRDEGFVVTKPGARGVTALPSGAATPNVPLPIAPSAGGMLDLAYATLPAPEEVARAYTAALRALPAYLPTHGYAPLGLPALREMIAERYTRRGLLTDAEQIIVTFGAQHAFSLLVRVLSAPGDRVLVDLPTYPHALDTLRQAGCRLVPVPLTEEGWDVSGLRVTMRQTAPRFAYLIPDFHNPTGRCMSAPQREAVARAAYEGRVTVVIDETLVDLALDVPVPRPFAAFEPRAQVVTLGSMSKSFWGGLRVGWLRSPRALASRIGAQRATVDLGAPVLEQLAALTLLEGAEPVLAARRGALRRQRDVLLEQLNVRLPGWRYAVPEGGLSLWATLPEPVSAVLAATSGRFGVRVAAGARFGTEGLFERQVRVPFTLPEGDLTEAVARLARAYAALTVYAASTTDADTTVV